METSYLNFLSERQMRIVKVGLQLDHVLQKQTVVSGLQFALYRLQVGLRGGDMRN
jgi:hypothetical protein